MNGAATAGTTTIEYDDGVSNSATFLAGGEDPEAHYIVKNNRVHSYNPRDRISSRLHKTIDDNLIINRLAAAA